jgi:hypothetical protein
LKVTGRDRRLSGHQDDWAAVNGTLQLFQPEADTAQGVAQIGGIEQYQRQIGIVHKERVDETVVGLTCEVPQDRLAVRAIGTALTKRRAHPEPLTMRGLLLLETIVNQSNAERRLADAVVAHENDLAGRMVDRRRLRDGSPLRPKQPIAVQLQ